MRWSRPRAAVLFSFAGVQSVTRLRVELNKSCVIFRDSGDRGLRSILSSYHRQLVGDSLQPRRSQCCQSHLGHGRTHRHSKRPSLLDLANSFSLSATSHPLPGLAARRRRIRDLLPLFHNLLASENDVANDSRPESPL